MKFKKLSVMFLIGLMAFSMAACSGEETDSKKDKKKVEESEEVSVPSKRDAKKAAEEEYDMSFEFVSEDISKKEDSAEWVFISKDGTLQVTVSWSDEDPDEFEFDDEELEVEDDDDDVIDDDDDVVVDDDVVIEDDDDDDVVVTNNKPDNTTHEKVDGLSDVYADLDNRSFVINGKVYELGVTTLQEMIDDGVPFNENDIANAGNNLNKNYTSGAFKIDLGDYYHFSVYVSNFTDSNMPANECIVTEVYLPVHQDEEPNGIVSFAFPLDITEDELRENSGDPTDFREYVSDDGKWTTHYCKYQIDSTKYYGSSGYDFEFSNGELKYLTIDYLP